MRILSAKSLCLMAVLVLTVVLVPAVSHAAADTDFVSKLVKEFHTKTSA